MCAALQGALARAFEPFLGWAARRYQAAVSAQLKNYGLRYEDLLDPINNLVSAPAACCVAAASAWQSGAKQAEGLAALSKCAPLHPINKVQLCVLWCVSNHAAAMGAETHVVN